MRKIATAALGLASLALAACSHPTPTPYANQGWNFAVTFQAPPKVTETKASAAGPASLLVEANGAGHDFAVNVLDASGSTSTPDQILSSAPATVAQAMTTDVGQTTYVATDGVTGREVRFDKDSKPALLMRIFVSGGRVYEVSADVPKGVDDPTVKGFLDSFHLLNPPPPPAPVPTSAPAANATNSTVPSNAG